MFENGVLRKTVGSRRGDEGATGGSFMICLCTEISAVMRWVGHVARIGRREKRRASCGKNMKERDPLTDQDLDGRVA